MPWFAAFCGAAWALVAGLALCVLPAMVVWLSDGASENTSQPLRTGARVWVLGLGADVTLDDVAYSLTPLGLTLIILVLALRAARWAAHSAGVETSRQAGVVIASLVATFVLGAGVVAGVAAEQGTDVVPVEAMMWAALWSGVAAGVGVGQESGLAQEWMGRLPPTLQVGAVGAAVAMAALTVGSAMLVLVSVVLHSDRIAALVTGLEAGAVGTIILIVLSAIYLPTMIAWAGAFALGPGFAFGADTAVAPTGVDLGLVPALPVFGALPSGDLGTLGWLTLALPVLAGVAAGALVVRRSPNHARLTRAVRAAVSGVLAAGAASIVAALSGGALGDARLADIGAVPWQLAAATIVLVGLPAVLTAVVPGSGADAAHADTNVDDVSAADAS